MSDAPLDPQELEAIQDAMREARSSAARGGATDQPEAVPLALIADDRDAESARPAGLRLGERWARLAPVRLRHHLNCDIEMSVAGAEVIAGPPARDELGGMWLCTVAPSDRSCPALVAVGGPIVELVAARLCGDRDVQDDADRPPSAAALRIFTPIGRAIADALVLGWADEQHCEVRIDTHTDHVAHTRRAITDADVVIAVTIAISGAITGRARLLAKPATLVPPPRPIEAIPAAPGAIEEALGRVPVQVTVELGRACLTMRDLAVLRVGAVLALDHFVDDPLPIECAGVVKAYGRPVVSRGMLAVEVQPMSTRERKQAA